MRLEYKLGGSKCVSQINLAIKYLRKTGAIRCKGGVPTSMMDSGQQWDFPNAWPPLQHILVAGKIYYSKSSKSADFAAARKKNVLNFSMVKWAK